MKKIVVCLMITLFVVGCSGASIKDDAVKTLVVKSSSRVLGYKMAEKDKTAIEPMKLFCKSLAIGNIDQAVFDAAKMFLNEKFKDDPLLAASIADLAGLVKLGDSTGYDPELVKTAALGILEGVQLYETKKPQII